MKRLQDELSEIAKPIHDEKIEQRIRIHKWEAEAKFDELKERAKEASAKGDKHAYVTINPHDRFTFPMYALEDLLKEHFDRYSIEDFGANNCAKIIYVYWK